MKDRILYRVTVTSNRISLRNIVRRSQIQIGMGTRCIGELPDT